MRGAKLRCALQGGVGQLSQRVSGEFRIDLSERLALHK
jgi:hypothetical protein